MENSFHGELQIINYGLIANDFTEDFFVLSTGSNANNVIDPNLNTGVIDDERVVRTGDYTYLHDSVMIVNDPSNPLVPDLYNFRIEVAAVGTLSPIEDGLKITEGFIRVLEAPGAYIFHVIINYKG